MKEILWSKIIQDYRDHIINHNLRNKTAKQLQEENIGSCRTCYPAKGSPPIAFLTFFSVACRNLLAQSYTSRTVALFIAVFRNVKILKMSIILQIEHTKYAEHKLNTICRIKILHVN